MILKEIEETFDLSSVSHLIEKSTYFIITDRIRGKITPTFGRKSIYVIRADYSYKVYEITSKAIITFVYSFRKNLRYGEDLLKLCDDLEEFGEKLKERSKDNPVQDKYLAGEEVKDYLDLLEDAEVVR